MISGPPCRDPSASGPGRKRPSSASPPPTAPTSSPWPRRAPGKTTFALTAAVQDLVAHPDRRVVVVAPTQHLKHQWARAASRFDLHLEPQWSARDGRLPDDMHGIIVTYQQVAMQPRPLRGVADGAFVIFDELHHAGEDRAWGEGVRHAFEVAARRLAISGTPVPVRHRGHPVRRLRRVRRGPLRLRVRLRRSPPRRWCRPTRLLPPDRRPHGVGRPRRHPVRPHLRRRPRPRPLGPAAAHRPVAVGRVAPGRARPGPRPAPGHPHRAAPRRRPGDRHGPGARPGHRRAAASTPRRPRHAGGQRRSHGVGAHRALRRG